MNCDVKGPNAHTCAISAQSGHRRRLHTRFLGVSLSLTKAAQKVSLANQLNEKKANPVLARLATSIASRSRDLLCEMRSQSCQRVQSSTCWIIQEKYELQVGENKEFAEHIFSLTLHVRDLRIECLFSSMFALTLATRLRQSSSFHATHLETL